MPALPPVRCPSCRKSNAPGTPDCTRCGCHLAHLAAIAASAAAHRHHAYLHLLAGRTTTAQHLFQIANHLHRPPHSAPNSPNR